MTQPQLISWLEDKMQPGKAYSVTPEQVRKIKEAWPMLSLSTRFNYKFNSNFTKIQKHEQS